MQAYPIYFLPVYKDYLWGGRKILEYGNRTVPFSKVAESWEIADRKDGMSVVENGVYANLPLADLMRFHAVDLVGKKMAKFPLLVKIIDARESLSLQVHPNEKTAQGENVEPKTELWYILDAKKGAKVLVGFSKETNEKEFLELAEKKELLSLLNQQPVQKDDAVFIPGGTIHAIMQGCFILEVQQNSNTTYRIYDWERGRKLHLQEAVKTLTWEKRKTVLSPQKNEKNCRSIHKSSHFSIKKWEKSYKKKGPFSSFFLFFLQKGKATIKIDGFEEELKPFRLCLAPASSRSIEIDLEEGAFLEITQD